MRTIPIPQIILTVKDDMGSVAINQLVDQLDVWRPRQPDEMPPLICELEAGEVLAYFHFVISLMLVREGAN